MSFVKLITTRKSISMSYPINRRLSTSVICARTLLNLLFKWEVKYEERFDTSTYTTENEMSEIPSFSLLKNMGIKIQTNST